MANRKRVSIVAIIVVFAMLLGSITAFAAEISPNGIFVSTSGEVETEADFATVSLGVKTTDKVSTKARNENANLVKKVEDALIKQGVSEKDIRNDYINMYPTYDYSGGGEKITGYSVSNDLSVKIKDLDKLADIVNAALAAGANNLNNINFDVEDRDFHYANAVNKAMTSARKKASIIAKEAKLTLGNVTSVSESGYDYPNYYGGSFSMGLSTTDQGVAEKDVYDLGNTLKPAPVKISVSLSVSFAANPIK